MADFDSLVFVDQAKFKADQLFQGDILERTEELQEAIREAHAYYANADDYSHFVVITQSCDLVRRGGRAPKARYLTIAAARPLDLVVSRFLRRHEFNGHGLPVAICQREREIFAKQLLERLLHNTEEGYFFIRKGSAPSVVRDLCVFLPLSIALRSSVHYDACVRAKRAQMNDIFSAKVGWLVGNQYSRVATPDLEEEFEKPDEYKSNFYQEVLLDKAVWLSATQFRELQRRTNAWRKTNPGQEISQDVVASLLQDLPDDATMIARRVVEVLGHRKMLNLDGKSPDEAAQVIRNDPALVRMLRGVTQ